MFYDCKSFNALGFSIDEIRMIFLEKKKRFVCRSTIDLSIEFLNLDHLILLQVRCKSEFITKLYV
jgi:hypothetical protein